MFQIRRVPSELWARSPVNGLTIAAEWKASWANGVTHIRSGGIRPVTMVQAEMQRPSMMMRLPFTRAALNRSMYSVTDPPPSNVMRSVGAAGPGRKQYHAAATATASTSTVNASQRMARMSNVLPDRETVALRRTQRRAAARSAAGVALHDERRDGPHDCGHARLHVFPAFELAHAGLEADQHVELGLDARETLADIGEVCHRLNA